MRGYSDQEIKVAYEELLGCIVINIIIESAALPDLLQVEVKRLFLTQKYCHPVLKPYASTNKNLRGADNWFG